MRATCSPQSVLTKKEVISVVSTWLDRIKNLKYGISYSFKKSGGNKRLKFFQLDSGESGRREWPRSWEKSFKIIEQNNSYLLLTCTLRSVACRPETLKCRTGRAQSDGPTAGTLHLQDPDEHQRASCHPCPSNLRKAAKPERSDMSSFLHASDKWAFSVGKSFILLLS